MSVIGLSLRPLKINRIIRMQFVITVNLGDCNQAQTMAIPVENLLSLVVRWLPSTYH